MIVLVTKFLAGAWITILAMGVFFATMRASAGTTTGRGGARGRATSDQVLPTRVHAIVLVSKLHKPTMRALAYARPAGPTSSRPSRRRRPRRTATGSSTSGTPSGIDVPLKMLYSPYREVIRPIVQYAVEIREANPRGVVAVYIPEYVVGRWWEQLLHNQTALRLKGRLLFTPGVMVTSVPYQLRGSEMAKERDDWDRERARPGDVRRGRTRTGR